MGHWPGLGEQSPQCSESSPPQTMAEREEGPTGVRVGKGWFQKHILKKESRTSCQYLSCPESPRGRTEKILLGDPAPHQNGLNWK